MLRAKLQAPTINKNIVSREKLHQKLQRGAESKLTLIVAPVGYGKTTAVLDWMRNCGLPTAWMSVDAGAKIRLSIGPGRPASNHRPIHPRRTLLSDKLSSRKDAFDDYQPDGT